MIIDALLMMADAQGSTVSAASTDYIDTLKAGDSYDGAWFVVRIDTAVTASGGATVTFDLRTDASSGFGTDTVLVSTGAIPKATLVAGYTFAVKIPKGAARYLRGYATIATGPLLTGKWDMFIAKDVDLELISQV